MSDIELQPQFQEIDVTKLTTATALRHYIISDEVYLLMFNGRFTVGTFSEDRRRFNPVALGSMSLQIGYPFRDNSSSGGDMQRLWHFVNWKEIRAADEIRYAQNSKQSSIKRGMYYRGVRIDETSPIEAWYYDSSVPIMSPKKTRIWITGHYEDEDGNWLDDEDDDD
jgi:hypothetical protein